jgi:hypothetical protein
VVKRKGQKDRPAMDNRFSIVFAALLILVAILNMTHGAPPSLNIWEFFDWMSGH